MGPFEGYPRYHTVMYGPCIHAVMMSRDRGLLGDRSPDRCRKSRWGYGIHFVNEMSRIMWSSEKQINPYYVSKITHTMLLDTVFGGR